jgi:hypothetical protein
MQGIRYFLRMQNYKKITIIYNLSHDIKIVPSTTINKQKKQPQYARNFQKYSITMSNCYKFWCEIAKHFLSRMKNYEFHQNDV